MYQQRESNELKIVQAIPIEDRRLMATWALKTARTEEWTGQQVIRLLSVSQARGGIPSPDEIVRHAAEEFRHSALYAGFAETLLVDDAASFVWLGDYAAKRSNFRDAGFTAIFRTMDAIPLAPHGGNERHRIRFYMALFFLDLAGLMTVNVYDEAPFESLQRLALEIRGDESRHVQFGRDYLIAGGDERRPLVREAALEMLPMIESFLGGDESPLQKTLAKHGIRNTSNADLRERFRAKIQALLRIEL